MLQSNSRGRRIFALWQGPKSAHNTVFQHACTFSPSPFSYLRITFGLDPSTGCCSLLSVCTFISPINCWSTARGTTQLFRGTLVNALHVVSLHRNCTPLTTKGNSDTEWNQAELWVTPCVFTTSSQRQGNGFYNSIKIPQGSIFATDNILLPFILEGHKPTA